MIDPLSGSILDPDLAAHLLSPTELARVEQARPKDPCPPLDPSLIDWLLRHHHPPTVRPGVPADATMYQAGAWSIVQELYDHYQQQQKEGDAT